MTEKQIKSGAYQDIYDSRDYKWSEMGKGSTPFDWNIGYDIESVMGLTINPKDQNGSGSCGGQAFSYYGAIKEALMTGTYEERSAKFLYAQCYVPSGGSRGRDLCDIAINQGFGRETFTPSYENGNPPNEEFMIRSQDITDLARQEAKSTLALSYASVDSANIDAVAQAIRDNHGCVIGITGENGKGWLTTYPLPATKTDWRHWVYAGKAKMINGKKHIGIINSWGDIGERGWQWVSEDYFNARIDGVSPVWSAWTLVLKKIDASIERKNIIQIIMAIIIKWLQKI